MEFKYDEQLYTSSTILGDCDEGVYQLTRKVVKTRTEHVCYNCQHQINKGDYALRETAIVQDIGRRACYCCIPCLDQWIELFLQVPEVEGR